VRDAKSITVKCPDVPSASADLRENAASTDLAILRIAGPTPAYLSLARSRSIRLGDAVFTIGFPATNVLGVEPKFTEGSVSALSGPGGEATLLQISVPVQPGNSGGPLVNSQGQVVGVVTSTAAIKPFIAATGTLPQNVTWAVKAEYALPLLDSWPSRTGAASRSEAIEQAVKATCMVEATTG
jgi:S1-C subfamily serine protease